MVSPPDLLQYTGRNGNNVFASRVSWLLSTVALFASQDEELSARLESLALGELVGDVLHGRVGHASGAAPITQLERETPTRVVVEDGEARERRQRRQERALSRQKKLQASFVKMQKKFASKHESEFADLESQQATPAENGAAEAASLYARTTVKSYQCPHCQEECTVGQSGRPLVLLPYLSWTRAPTAAPPQSDAEIKRL